MLWSWILAVVGLVGFVLAGRKIWWCWYINIAAQALWFAYALVTKQYGFIASSIVYAVVFSQNAYKWTKEHRDRQSKHRQPHFVFDESLGKKVCCCNCIACTLGDMCVCLDCTCEDDED